MAMFPEQILMRFYVENSVWVQNYASLLHWPIRATILLWSL